MSEFQDWNMFAFFVIICGSQATCESIRIEEDASSILRTPLGKGSYPSVDKTLLLNGEPP
jgi:hypothetical protein